jgi:rare lipoprotein A
LIQSLNNLALLLIEQEKYREATPLSQRALEIKPGEARTTQRQLSYRAKTTIIAANPHSKKEESPPIIGIMKYVLSFLLIILPFLCQADETGYASWYGGKFHGRYTASGEIYDMNKLTAAHKTLPFGTMVKVINTENGKSIVVKINDRGPFVEGRIIDLSRAAAEKIGMLKTGIAKVIVEIVSEQEQKETVYAIQVGSYIDPGNAETLKKALEEKGYPIIISTTASMHHRVIIEPVTSANLEKTLKELTELGFHDVIVRKK